MIDAVGDLDLSAFYAGYRNDGHGRPAYEPSMMVALLLYAYATNQRSARAIERHCRQDVAYRVISANVVPDHATIARFVVRHEAALGGLFTAVLGLCAKAGLVGTGVVAIDGTKLKASASPEANLDYGQIAREIIEEAKATDAAEDELYGEARGDELPEQLRTAEGRRAWLAEAKRGHEEEGGDAPDEQREGAPEEAQVVRRAADQGRRGWIREARRDLDERRRLAARPVPRSRAERLLEASGRLEEELEAERQANAAYEAYRARGRMKDGRRFGKPPKPHELPQSPAGKVNLTDPDARLLKVRGGYVQGYNAQAAVTEEQIVVAAEITVESPDFGQLEPMVDAALAELERAGVEQKPQVALADAGYWHHDQIDSVAARGIAVLIPPDSRNRKTTRPGWEGGRYAWMRRLLATEPGKRLYRKRSQTVEPVFGHTKHNRCFERFHRRGRGAVRTE
ncbi:MAG: transposase, partial [Actinobacteria bacterium]|nr:transposase [Actinomycetota bacterium]